MGFLGSDPELRNNGIDQLYDTSRWQPSPPTKRRSHTSRDRMASLRGLRQALRVRCHADQGSHLQVEGELRSRDYVSPKTGSAQRTWEVRVASILRLDRAVKTSAPEEPAAEPAPGKPLPRSGLTSYRRPGFRLGRDCSRGDCHEIEIPRSVSSRAGVLRARSQVPCDQPQTLAPAISRSTKSSGDRCRPGGGQCSGLNWNAISIARSFLTRSFAPGETIASCIRHQAPGARRCSESLRCAAGSAALSRLAGS